MAKLTDDRTDNSMTEKNYSLFVRANRGDISKEEANAIVAEMLLMQQPVAKADVN